MPSRVPLPIRLFCVVFVLPALVRGNDVEVAQLKGLSLEELLGLEVTTVSRKEERWWGVASGIDIVTAEDIRRSGARNIPDALRLATGVHVGQSSARSWAVSIRGMNVLAANKISVAMDGRSLFTPFFSGVNWDAQDTLLEDVDRIEVVRGPVGASWGAFAVNGFIQILTKPAWETQGWLVSAGTGTEDPGFASVRYGGRTEGEVYYRAYARYFQTEWTYDAAGRRAQPPTDFLQAGFRADARREDGTLTVQGDTYTNQDLPEDRLQTEINGQNVLGRWRREGPDGTSLQAEGYYERTYRLIPAQFEETRETVSASVKRRREGGRHDLLVGADALVSWDDIGNIGVALLEPRRRTTRAVGVFGQDTIGLGDRHDLVLGLKLDHNSFSGFEWQPTARWAWTPSPRTTVWAAASRAVRTPVRVDEDLVLRFNGVTFFEAHDGFGTEVTFAYEAGWRHQPRESLTLDVSAFAYDYRHLRSTEPAGAGPLPLTFGNLLEADSAGAEATAMWQPHPRVFLKASYRQLDLGFRRRPGSADVSGGAAEGNDPKRVAVLGVRLDLPRGWEFDAYLRHAGDLPNPALPGYTVADVRIGWRASERWEISLAARNLGDRQFPEFVTTNSLNEQVRRRLTAKVTWRH